MMIRVLIADDQAVVRGGLRVLLESNPEIAVVGEASHGKQVLQQIRDFQPDIVIMDISLPEMNGVNITQRIMEFSPETRVILLSKVDRQENVFHTLQAGAQGYLLLESAAREVMEAVRAVYAGKVYLSQPVKKTLISDYLHQRGELQQ